MEIVSGLMVLNDPRAERADHASDDSLEQANLPEEERTGYMGGQECAKQAKQKLSAEQAALFAPAAGTLH